MHAGKPLQLFNEREGLFLRDELGGLHDVHQQLQLRQLKIAAADIVFSPVLHDIQPEVAQGFKVVIQALAFGGNAVLPQRDNQLRHGDRMRLVGPFQKKPHQIQKLQLLIG